MVSVFDLPYVQASLRRLVYLIVTEVNPDPGEAFMIVSTLMQDVTKDRSPDLFRGNAIRVLSKIIDVRLNA